jgi:hypothetical protein
MEAMAADLEDEALGERARWRPRRIVGMVHQPDTVGVGGLHALDALVHRAARHEVPIEILLELDVADHQRILAIAPTNFHPLCEPLHSAATPSRLC